MSEDDQSRTLNRAESQVFRLAHRAHQQRVAASAQQLNADLAVLELGNVHITAADETEDGRITLTCAPSS